MIFVNIEQNTIVAKTIP